MEHQVWIVIIRMNIIFIHPNKMMTYKLWDLANRWFIFFGKTTKKQFSFEFSSSLKLPKERWSWQSWKQNGQGISCLGLFLISIFISNRLLFLSYCFWPNFPLVIWWLWLMILMGIGDEEDEDEDDKAAWQVDEWWWLWWWRWRRWRRWGLQNYVTSWLLREAHRAEVDRAKEVEQQLAEAYRSLQNIIIMMEIRRSRWCASAGLFRL